MHSILISIGWYTLLKQPFAIIFINSGSLITARKRSLGQGNIFSSMCQEFCSQGGLPQYMLGYHPWCRQLPPGAVHAGRYDQQAGGMHPTGMQSCVEYNF